VYGFAQNSHLLDRGFLLGSIALIVVWAVFPSHYALESASYSALTSGWTSWAAGYGFVALLYAAGETERRDANPKLPWLKPAQKPLLAAGVAAFILWLAVTSGQILGNVENILGDPEYAIASAVAVVATSALVVYWMSRDNKSTMV
jgi:hypothetical protein